MSIEKVIEWHRAQIELGDPMFKTVHEELIRELEAGRLTHDVKPAATAVDFEREDRYFVIKKSHHSADHIVALERLFERWKIRTVQCVVVEADWPEYEPVWAMISDRVTGQPAPSRSVDHS